MLMMSVAPAKPAASSASSGRSSIVPSIPPNSAANWPSRDESGGMTTRRGSTWRTPVAWRIGATTSGARGVRRAGLVAHDVGGGGLPQPGGRAPGGILVHRAEAVLLAVGAHAGEATWSARRRRSEWPGARRRYVAEVEHRNVDRGRPELPIAGAEEEAVDESRPHTRAPPPSAPSCPGSANPARAPGRRPRAENRERARAQAGGRPGGGATPGGLST